MISEFIDKLIELITELGYKTVSPAFSQDNENNVCVTILNGQVENNSCGKITPLNVPFRVLTRPNNESDSESLEMSEKILNKLNVLNDVEYGNYAIVIITAQNTPNYAYTDENNRVLYNTFFNAILERRI